MHFIKDVNLQSKDSMLEFLRNHPRYSTMNSVNRCQSYAHNIKVHHLGLPERLELKAYDFVGLDEVQEMMASHIEQFTQEHFGAYTIGSNGRSGGYLVLYQSSYETTEHKSRCVSCGQLNFQPVGEGPEASNTCGACGAKGLKGRINLTSPIRRVSVYPGRGLDDDIDLEEMSEQWLRGRCALVMAFDQVCEDIRAEFIEMLQSFKVVEQAYTVMRTRNVLEVA